MSAIAREHGISRQTVSAFKQEGVDLTDPEAVADRVAIMRDKAAAPSLAEERRRKLKADADMAEIKVAQTKGELISRDEVREEMVRVGTIFGAALERLQADLPPLLEGMEVSAMAGAIREKTDEVRRAMLEEYKRMDDVGRGA